MEGGRRGSHEAHSPGLVIARVRSWVLAVLHACSLVEGSSSFVGVHGRSSAFMAVVMAVVRCCPWGGVVVVCGAQRSWMGCGRPWALDIHEWGSSMGGQRLWVVVVVYGGRLCGVSSVGGRGHLRGCRVLVGDGGAVVIVVPCHPGLWAFIARKVAINVART